MSRPLIGKVAHRLRHGRRPDVARPEKAATTAAQSDTSHMDDVTVDGWVWPSTVHTMMVFLSSFVDYGFGYSDWDAVRFGLEATDADRTDGFYEYPLVGNPVLTVRLARNVGADPVNVSVTGRMGVVLEARIDTLISVLASVEGREI
jgi:hypothetical protein